MKIAKMVLEILVFGNFGTYENFGKVSFSVPKFMKITKLVLVLNF